MKNPTQNPPQITLDLTKSGAYWRGVFFFDNKGSVIHSCNLFLSMPFHSRVKWFMSYDKILESPMLNGTNLAEKPQKSVDPVWETVRRETSTAAAKDPALAVFLFSTILNHNSLESAVIHRVSERLDHADVPAAMIRQTYHAMAQAYPQWAATLRVDLQAVFDRDPACERFIDPLLYFKGFHAIQTHRLAHWLWENDRKDFALYLQSRASAIFQVDIHPAVKMGQGIFFDHATGIVVGMTAVIDDDVSILQGVTLGGTGKETGDRHPKIGRGVLIGAGAEILGNIEIGGCSKVAAGSVVLKAVPKGVTVAGVPARIVGEAGCAEPSRAMNQLLSAELTDDESDREREG